MGSDGFGEPEPYLSLSEADFGTEFSPKPTRSTRVGSVGENSLSATKGGFARTTLSSLRVTSFDDEIADRVAVRSLLSRRMSFIKVAFMKYSVNDEEGGR